MVLNEMYFPSYDNQKKHKCLNFYLLLLHTYFTTCVVSIWPSSRFTFCLLFYSGYKLLEVFSSLEINLKIRSIFKILLNLNLELVKQRKRRRIIAKYVKVDS